MLWQRFIEKKIPRPRPDGSRGRGSAWLRQAAKARSTLAIAISIADRGCDCGLRHRNRRAAITSIADFEIRNRPIAIAIAAKETAIAGHWQNELFLSMSFLNKFLLLKSSLNLFDIVSWFSDLAAPWCIFRGP